MPQDIYCPLCRDETVELKENNSGNPFFYCDTFRSAVNMRPESDESTEILSELAEETPESETESEPEPAGEGEEGEDTTTLADLMDGDA